MIHLDTSFLIRALVPGTPADRQLRAWFSGGVPVNVSSLVWCEFLCGPLDEASYRTATEVLPTPVPMVADDATLAAMFFNRSGRRRGTLVDCMIAAIACRCGATLATDDPSDFARFVEWGLRLHTTE